LSAIRKAFALGRTVRSEENKVAQTANPASVQGIASQFRY